MFVDVRGLSRAALAELFLRAGIRVLGLAPVRMSLQDAYAGLTSDLEQYRSAGALPEQPGARQGGRDLAWLPEQPSISSSEGGARP